MYLLFLCGIILAIKGAGIKTKIAFVFKKCPHKTLVFYWKQRQADVAFFLSMLIYFSFAD